MRATGTPYRSAITESTSPDFTVYTRTVGVLLLALDPVVAVVTVRFVSPLDDVPSMLRVTTMPTTSNAAISATGASQRAGDRRTGREGMATDAPG